jgi:hypothetical protein
VEQPPLSFARPITFLVQRMTQCAKNLRLEFAIADRGSVLIGSIFMSNLLHLNFSHPRTRDQRCPLATHGHSNIDAKYPFSIFFLMKIPSCALPVWKKLYDTALAFGAIEPWGWMSDIDVFGVQNPESGEIGYCCVLGELGEVYGLVVYLGSAGLEQHREIESGKVHAGSPDFAYGKAV